MRILIGIDDTDNKESRGTGYNSRQLASAIESAGYGIVHGITRHQLFVHPDIPYTSQNSSACLDVSCGKYSEIRSFVREFMLNIGAEGSDVGVCIAKKDEITDDIINWGNNAKSIVLKMNDASDLASKHGIYLEGLTGTHIGIIGALAAIGLRKGGNDGRFIWIRSTKNLRDIEQDVHTIDVLLTEAGIDIVQYNEKSILNPDDKVYLNGWARPVLRNGKSVLLVDNEVNNMNYEWKCSTKEFVKRVSN
jgi:hypothetical protein